MFSIVLFIYPDFSFTVIYPSGLKPAYILGYRLDIFIDNRNIGSNHLYSLLAIRHAFHAIGKEYPGTALNRNHIWPHIFY